MLDFHVAWLPLIVVAVANFILSWVYYSPMAPWFKTWQKGVGADPTKTEMTDQQKKAMPALFGGAIVATLLLPYGLEVLIHSLKVVDFGTGALVGVVIWIGFAVTHSLNTLFEGRKLSVVVINNAWYLVTYAGFGGLIAVWN